MEKDIILVVDDEYSNRLLLEELLFEYEVVTADCGNAMWKVLEHKSPSLILMDVMMPETDGFTLVKQLQNKPEFQDIPVVFVTAKVTGGDVEKGFDLGGYDYIKKPFNQQELESRVKTALENSKKVRKLESKSITADAVVESMSDGVIVADINGLVAKVNPAGEKLFGTANENLIGVSASSLFFSDQIKGNLSSIRDKMNIETSIICVDERKIPVLASISPVYQSSSFDGWVFVIHDISAQKETETKLREAKDKAEEADKLKSAFLANMSHEIRTPMNSIIGFSELLEDSDTEEEERAEYISIIQKNSDKLLNFFDNLLDISIIESGQITINDSDCYVNQILNELEASFALIKKKLDKDHVTLNVSKGLDDPNFFIKTDNFRVQQVLTNLIGNALKFTKEGSVEFGYTLTESVNGIEMLRFHVKDTGVGIPEDKQKIIFDRFGQVKNQKVQNLSGAGLGLAISKHLVELLGGDLSVQSEVNRGSEFYFSLPID